MVVFPGKFFKFPAYSSSYYLKPCFVSLCVNSVCFVLKALKLSQILPILTSWDMPYTPYVSFAGILPSKNRNQTTLKEKFPFYHNIIQMY